MSKHYRYYAIVSLICCLTTGGGLRSRGIQTRTPCRGTVVSVAHMHRGARSTRRGGGPYGCDPSTVTCKPSTLVHPGDEVTVTVTLEKATGDDGGVLRLESNPDDAFEDRPDFLSVDPHRSDTSIKLHAGKHFKAATLFVTGDTRTVKCTVTSEDHVGPAGDRILDGACSPIKVVFSKNPIVQGDQVTVTVTLSAPAPSSGEAITITPSDLMAWSRWPGSWPVAAGSSTTSFTMTSSSSYSGSSTVSVATPDGCTGASTSLTTQIAAPL